jgi:hypothetical protein
MQWLLHGALTSAVGDALVRHGEHVHALAELGLAEGASVRDLVLAAGRKQWDLITNDAVVVKWIYEDRFPFKRSIVFLQLEGGDVEQDDAVDRLFARYKRLTPGRLYTVTASRVKIRQLPTGGRGHAAHEAAEEE